MKLITKRNMVLALYIITIAAGYFLNLALWFTSLLCLLYTAVVIAVNFKPIVVYTGNYFMARNNTELAKKIYKGAIAKNTIYPTAYLNLAIITLREGDAKTALSLLEQGLERTPSVLTEKNIYLTMGSCYWVLGDIDKAITVLEGMRRRYEYVNAHVLMTLGFMYLLKDDYEMATSCTDKAIQDNPELASAWDNRGQINYRLGNMDVAKEAFEKAVSLKFDLIDSQYYLALIYFEQGNTEKAREHIRLAEKCTATVLNTVGMTEVEELKKKIG